MLKPTVIWAIGQTLMSIKMIWYKLHTFSQVTSYEIIQLKIGFVF